MTSALYPSYKESCLSYSPSTDLDTDTIKVRLVALQVYTYSAAHNMADDVTKYVGTTDQTLATKTVAAGVFDADDVVFTAVAVDAANTVGAIVIFKDTGTPSTSPLIAYIDGFTAVTPNGGNISVAWSSGASRIFAL